MSATPRFAKPGDAVASAHVENPMTSKSCCSLSNKPMTDEEFERFMCIENDEITIELVNFAKPTQTVFLFNPKTLKNAADTVQRAN